jgi:hypothetical protein
MTETNFYSVFRGKCAEFNMHCVQKFYITYFNSHFAENTATAYKIQNKSQFYSDSFYRIVLYFKIICKQKVPVTDLVFVLCQTASKISIFYCSLVFRDFHSGVQIHVRFIVNFGTSCKPRPVFIVRSSVLKLNIIIYIIFTYIYIYIYIFQINVLNL